MKVIYYCQHVLGVGHIFRTIEICRALAGHDIILVSGGPRITKTLPGHVRGFHLPELGMDKDFKALFTPRNTIPVDQVKQQRQRLLYELFEKEKPDLFIVELYPFGRKGFRFELDPVLYAIREDKLTACGVLCSVRDILVEKENQPKHESRAVKTLNDCFDVVLVHSDPNLVGFGETFLRMEEIAVPVVYTGFIAPKPAPDARASLRKHLGISEDDLLIVASAGGGSVGAPLLEAAIAAFKLLKTGRAGHLQVFTGPFIDKKNGVHLKSLAGPRIVIRTFVPDFLSYLAAADLSISMAGYNTGMNILAARVRALVWPFSKNREQGLRAERLERIGALKVLQDRDLLPERLAAIMAQALSRPAPSAPGLNMEGAQNTAEWIEAWAQKKGGK
jgi:predicted glycosyltransferase